MYLYIYTYISIYIYVYVYIYIYINIHTHTHTHTHNIGTFVSNGYDAQAQANAQACDEICMYSYPIYRCIHNCIYLYINILDIYNICTCISN